MRNRRSSWNMPGLGLVCFILLFSFCASKPVMTLTGADNGRTVEMKKGEVLAVSLDAQLGTGYGWRVVPGNRLAQDGEPAQEPVGKAKPGGHERQIFRFRAIERGEAVLRLQYAQGWKKDVKPLREFTVTVIIR